MIGLCDCNNFFVSCQRVFRPDLDGKPVLVLSGNDGCVIARSNEVKALGVKMGVPLYQVRDIITKNRVTLFSANHRLYADMSQRVMSTLRAHTPAIDIYSVDEAFIDFSGRDLATLKEHTEQLSKLVKRHTGIPVSIGIAPTKTLAKIASALCKQYPKLNGSCLMYRPEDIEKVLRGLTIDQVWGIGRKSTQMLRSAGVYSAYDFTQRSRAWVQAKMGITGVRTWCELRSEPCIEFVSTPSISQSISIGRSFHKEITELDELSSVVTIFATTIASKLRKQGSCAGTITTYIYTNRHRKDKPQTYESETVQLEIPTDSTLEIVQTAIASLRKIFKGDYSYKKAGVICSNLSSKESVQTSLFDTVDREKHTKLMRSIDHLNANFGNKTIIMAGEAGAILDPNKSYLSPNYTSQWSDIISVKK